MQKELEEAGDLGYEYLGQTVFQSTCGGREVVVILERDKDAPRRNWKYNLLATSKTSTMEKELKAAGALGYEFVGVTVGPDRHGRQRARGHHPKARRREVGSLVTPPSPRAASGDDVRELLEAHRLGQVVVHAGLQAASRGRPSWRWP